MTTLTIREKLEQREFQTLSEIATKSANSKGRKVEEPQSDLRTDFQRDRDRILHSKAFRRLKHKTQVFLSPFDDHFRTRLTHTLEVSQIARTIARALDLNEDLVEAIALGGSRATGRNDTKSDYDVYVYITDNIDENTRRRILEKYCGYMEIGNSFWELEDDVTLKDGIDMADLLDIDAKIDGYNILMPLEEKIVADAIINIDDNTQNMVRPYFTKAIKQINDLDDKHKIEFKGLLTNYKKIFLHLKIIFGDTFSDKLNNRYIFI